MPLTQSRFLAALDEALDAHSEALALRGDLYSALASNVPNARKLDVITHLLDSARVPLTLERCERERDHIVRSHDRNARAARRMRKSRRAKAQKGD